MKKILKTLLSAMAVSCVLASAGANAAVTLRLGYEPPRTDSQHLAAAEFKRIVEEKTGGELVVKLFPDSTLGNTNALINGVRNGTIDMTICGANNFSGLTDAVTVLDIPYLFKSKEEAFKVLDSEIGDEIMKSLEPVGIKGLALWDNGFRHMSNNKHPILKPEDVKGLKMRVPNNPMQVKVFEVLGANPVPMPLGELYTALETHTVDGQDHPLGVVDSSKLYEVQKYLSLTSHQYGALLFAMNKAKFDKLTPEQQTIVVDAAKVGANFQRKINAENQAKQIQTFRDAGVEVVEDIDVEPFKKAVFDEVSKFYTDKNGDEMIKKINAKIAE